MKGQNYWLIITALMFTCGANSMAIAATNASSSKNSTENTQKYSTQQNDQTEVALRCLRGKC